MSIYQCRGLLVQSSLPFSEASFCRSGIDDHYRVIYARACMAIGGKFKIAAGGPKWQVRDLDVTHHSCNANINCIITFHLLLFLLKPDILVRLPN